MVATIIQTERPTLWRQQPPASTLPPRHRPCPHRPACPSADAPDHDAARRVACHPEQGWSLLCNGVVCFDDTGELLPDGRTLAPHRPTDQPHTR